MDRVITTGGFGFSVKGSDHDRIQIIWKHGFFCIEFCFEGNWLNIVSIPSLRLDDASWLPDEPMAKIELTEGESVLVRLKRQHSTLDHLKLTAQPGGWMLSRDLLGMEHDWLWIPNP